MDPLPPGFRFYPTEEELISFYLHHKLHAQLPELDRVIPSIDIYNFEPFHLPDLAGQLCEGEKEQWFFFMAQQEREARGGRPTRTTGSGYWKATGSPSFVYSSQNRVIGLKKTMVFYKGKAPTGRKTKWKMNEYKAIKQEDNSLHNSNVSSASIMPQLRNEVSLCRVYVTSGCARAFDRRPQGVVISDNTNATHEDHVTTRNWNVNFGQGIGTSASQGINTANTLMENSGSTDSSNSGGDHDHLTIPNAAISGGINSINDINMIEAFGPLNLEDLGWI